MARRVAKEQGRIITVKAEGKNLPQPLERVSIYHLLLERPDAVSNAALYEVLTHYKTL